MVGLCVPGVHKRGAQSPLPFGESEAFKQIQPDPEEVRVVQAEERPAGSHRLRVQLKTRDQWSWLQDMHVPGKATEFLEPVSSL